MLKEDKQAGFICRKILFITVAYRFVAGDKEANSSLNPPQYARMWEEQERLPVRLMRDQATGKAWWLYRERFFWESDNLSAKDVQALIVEQERIKQRRIARAKNAMDLPTDTLTSRRRSIPDEVKEFVWRRDRGRCVKCGTQKDIEFDHVVPLSLNGSNTARNLQLLCAACNRSKGPGLY